MEKSNVESEEISSAGAVRHVLPRPRYRKTRKAQVTAALAILSILVLAYANPRGLYRLGIRYGSHKKFEPSQEVADPWESITPSERLEWTPCFSDFQCARLTVPMDYDRPLSSSRHVPKVHIALLLYPAKNTMGSGTFSPSVRPPMLINPGGPGGSGTMLAMFIARSIQIIFGDDQPVIGFDPRGIGYTLPRADCWATPPVCDDCKEDVLKGFFHRIEWGLANPLIGPFNSSDLAITYLDAGQRAVNDLCRTKDGQLGPESVLGHASTAHVARDMASIIDAWDEWQDTLRGRSGEAHRARGTTNSDSTRGKLVYWGFSYGTYLGATFASMFPDRIARVILDGVVDAEDYADPVWQTSLLDTDHVLEQFFEGCYVAGLKCHLHREGDQAADIRDRYRAIMKTLENDPITAIQQQRFTPVIITAAMVKTLVFAVLYSPIQGFPLLAQLLNEIYVGRGAGLAVGFNPIDLQNFCLMPGFPVGMLPGDAQRAILCSDKTQPVNLTLQEIKDSLEALAKTSEFADVIMPIHMQCNGYDIHAGHRRPTGWNDINERTQIQTSFPILFLSNTYDPVTPLASGVKMALKFRDAGLIEQKSAGHCTLSAVSRCTIKAIQDYVREGKTVPPPKVDGDRQLDGEWTTCEADEHPWNMYHSQSDRVGGSDASDAEIKEEMRVLEALQEVQHFVDLFSPRWGRSERIIDAAGRVLWYRVSY